MADLAAIRATVHTRKAGKPSTNASIGVGDSPDIRRKEAAQYISDLILELRNLAKANELFHVMVPLEYAYYEAFAAANKVEAPASEVERLKELSKVSEGLEA